MDPPEVPLIYCVPVKETTDRSRARQVTCPEKWILEPVVPLQLKFPKCLLEAQKWYSENLKENGVIKSEIHFVQASVIIKDALMMQKK